MGDPQQVMLFIDGETESQRALEVIRDVGIVPQIVKVTDQDADVAAPLLISGWGVSEGIESIIWFAKMITWREANGVDRYEGGVAPAGAV